MGWIQRLLNWFRKYLDTGARNLLPDKEQSEPTPAPQPEGQRFGPDEPLKKPQDASPPPPKPKHRVKKPQNEASLPRHDRRRLDALRHKYEKARMKHDEWVVPGGAEPVKFDQKHHDASIEDLITQKQKEEEQKPKPERLEPIYDPNVDNL